MTAWGVRLEIEEGDDRFLEEREPVTPREDGTFELQGVAPGRHVLRVTWTPPEGVSGEPLVRSGLEVGTTEQDYAIEGASASAARVPNDSRKARASWRSACLSRRRADSRLPH